ncbi:hypothetical protein H0H93_013679 [Arthromyces matolae]|nr:hypothetical protein H0H93_013679 [Arthromyces matolae]
MTWFACEERLVETSTYQHKHIENVVNSHISATACYRIQHSTRRVYLECVFLQTRTTVDFSPMTTIFRIETARTCGSIPTPAQFAAMEADFSEKLSLMNSSDSNAAYNIKYDSSPVSDRDNVIADQIKALNVASKNLNIQWTLAGTYRQLNRDWFLNVRQNNAKDTAMKKALRKGGVAELNVYTVKLTAQSLGYATFPYEYKANPKGDGVVVNYASVPKGSLTHYNLGHTLVHEAGHWIGLYHTFQGTDASGNQDGCVPPGDEVDDTPYQFDATDGCISRDSCPLQPGTDPIHNFMDYSYDVCMYEFTRGQGKRASEQLRAYRKL